MHTVSIKKIARTILVIALGIVLFLALVWKKQIAPPQNFPVPYRLTIERGQTLFSISRELQEAGLIQSPRFFEMFMLTFGNDRRVSEGEYYFSEPASALDIALRISGRQFGIERRKVTFPEGFTNAEMAARLTEVFPDFNAPLFLELAMPHQGVLFPDTYSFFPSIKPDVVVAALRKNFDKKIASLEPAIAASGHTRNDIITMASIIEKEANGPEDRAIVSGILWKRIADGMPLQVDAPFLFLLGKKSNELTLKDLALKSPYNTYLNKGLPPTPINNPGLAALQAAIYPEETKYVYYLHDSTGAIHYASTYAEHKKNIQQYLK
jgi:UPF0755 protein